MASSFTASEKKLRQNPKDNLCNHTQMSCQEKSGATSVSMVLMKSGGQINRDCSSEKNKQNRINSITAVQNRSTSLKLAEWDHLFPKPKGFQCYLTAGYGVPTWWQLGRRTLSYTKVAMPEICWASLQPPACQVTYFEPYHPPSVRLCCVEVLIVNEGKIKQLLSILPHFLSQSGEMSLEMGLLWALAWSLLLHLCLVPAAKNSNPVETITTARHVYII